MQFCVDISSEEARLDQAKDDADASIETEESSDSEHTELQPFQDQNLTNFQAGHRIQNPTHIQAPRQLPTTTNYQAGPNNYADYFNYNYEPMIPRYY